MFLENWHLRRCNENDLEEVLLLQEDVITLLKDPNILRKNNEELLRLALSENNISLGLFDEDKMIAVILVVDPVPPETDLRKGLKNHEVDHAMDFKLVLVREGYRGHRLQKSLMWIAEKLAYKKGIKYFVSSVSPDNMYSLNNFKLSHYEYDHEEELYGGLLREVYVKKLEIDQYSNAMKDFANKLIDTKSSLLVIDKTKYLSGDLDISSIGDVIEFKDDKSEISLFGFIIDDASLDILIQDESGVWKLKKIEELLKKYSICNVWINPDQNIDILPS